MKRFTTITLILILTHFGYAYADANSPLTIRNFFLGSTPSKNLNVNQVLALLVGPQGKPGPAGIAGRDGFIGMNGLDGKDGIPGAPGPVGPQGPQGPQGPSGMNGASGLQGPQGPQGPSGINGTNGSMILISVIETGTSDCNGMGGTRFTTNGISTFACNGNGGSGSGFSFGQGKVQLGVCDRDSSVGFEFPTRWNGEDFFLDRITISDVDGRCIDQTLKVYFKIKSSGSLAQPLAGYDFGDLITCSKTLSDAEPGLVSSPRASTSNSFKIASTTVCSHTNSSGAMLPSLILGTIGTRDLADTVGFEIS